MYCKIILLTTIGCMGCRVATNNIKKAISDSNIDIKFTIMDWHEYDNNMIHNLKIRDYPTALFLTKENGTDDYKVKYHVSGSYPIVCYTRWIDIYFR